MELEKLSEEYMIRVNQTFWYIILGEFKESFRRKTSTLLAEND